MRTILFGSVAKGSPTPNDIDIAVVATDEENLNEIAENLRISYPGSKIDFYPFYEKSESDNKPAKIHFHFLLMKEAALGDNSLLVSNVKGGLCFESDFL